MSFEHFTDEKNNNYPIKKTVPHFGSFYLRVGAIAFGIGTMVYSGLELGQYFELKSGDNDDGCNHVRKQKIFCETKTL